MPIGGLSLEKKKEDTILEADAAASGGQVCWTPLNKTCPRAEDTLAVARGTLLMCYLSSLLKTQELKVSLVQWFSTCVSRGSWGRNDPLIGLA